MSLSIEQNDDETTTIEGTRYANYLFKELGCFFTNNIGSEFRIDKKEDGVVTLTRLDKYEAINNS